MHFSKLEIKDIKTRLKYHGYNQSMGDNFMFRIGFKTGYRLANEHIKRKKVFIKEKSPNVVKKTRDKNIYHVDPKILNEITSCICKHYHVAFKDVCSAKRYTSLSIARSVCINILREKLNLSMPKIGRIVGNKDHTSVLYHLKSKHFKTNLWELSNKIWDDYSIIQSNLK